VAILTACFLLLLGVSLTAVAQEQEYNEPVILLGVIKDGKPNDHEFGFRNGESYIIGLEVPEGKDFDLYLYDGKPEKGGELLNKSTNGGSGVEGFAFVSNVDFIGILRVRPYIGSSGDYKIAIMDSKTRKVTVKSGYLSGKDDYDTYGMSLNKYSNVILLLKDPIGCDFDIYVYGTLIGSSGWGYKFAQSTEASDKHEYLNFVAPIYPKGQYTIQVKSYSGSGSYELYIIYDLF
jgi:hypothetical protein